MSEITKQDLKDLILSVDKKMEVGFAKLLGEFKGGRRKVKFRYSKEG